MFARNMFNPQGFKNTNADGSIIGFQFDFKLQYYRGITLSILRNIEVWVDDEEISREDIRFTVQEETFTLDEMKTVIDYRWRFGEWATITILKEGGVTKGPHHIKATQTIAPSYMPMILVNSGEYDFVIE